MHRQAPQSLRRFSTASHPPLTVGIRREDPQRIWERRTPLTPEAVHYLVSRDVKVDIEHCDRRVFPDAEYIKAGARVQPNLKDAHIIVGIKETPLNEVITSPIPTPSTSRSIDMQCARTHVMFSHTAKGQPHNTQLLGRFVASSQMPSPSYEAPRLVDYELLTDEDGKRTVAFGWFAGVAGVLESLSAMAHSHLEIGIASPFLYTPRPHTHPSLKTLRSALRGIGNQIAAEGTPVNLGPFVIGLTGNGNVSQGCLSMLGELPIVNVAVRDLHALVTNKDTDRRKIYLVHAKPEEYLVGLDGRAYDREHYYKHPQSYRSTFYEGVAPYLTLFLNGTGWAPGFPRLMTIEQLTVALDRAQSFGGARFTNIGDISCDVEGGLHFLTRATTLSSPFYQVRTPNLPASLPSVQMMSVDILPASLPLDASHHFSKVFLPYLESLIDHYTSVTPNSYTAALDRATIAEKGLLTEKHKWLQGAVDEFHGTSSATSIEDATGGISTPSVELAPGKAATSLSEKAAKPAGILRKKKVLMFGSGMVTGPAVDELAKRGDIQLLIVSNSLQEMEKVAQDYLNVQYRVIDISDKENVSSMVADADLVISLLPASLHPGVADLCISHRKHLVTASYISGDMRKLNDRAVRADVLLLNEIGLDPGIDHCSAIDLMSRLRAEGKEIRSFISFCGGLPAPEVANVPLRYKFSWSPRGVLSAALNPAQYLLYDNVINVPDNGLLDKGSYFPTVPITDKFELEGIPNRDSLSYSQTYGIGQARTILRGTLRYPGFASLMSSFQRLGLLETTHKIFPHRWTSLVSQSLEAILKCKIDDVGYTIASVVSEEQRKELLEALEWLSLIPPAILPRHPMAMPPLPDKPMAPIDLFTYVLAHRLAYQPHERDMVILSHEIIARPKGNLGFEREEVYTSQLITYGTPRASAMARTVGLPVAFAALSVLDGKVGLRGVHGPMEESVYRPVLRGLAQVGLGMAEKMRFVERGSRETIEGILARARRVDKPMDIQEAGGVGGFRRV